ncbi:transcription-repair coupling factor [Caldanaerobius fijiensis DSM 17918]|uniref:Transcription-repair-coupling factor n=1 Tax=Caldanaerobius fijiensis DSM 17918 TaxID=1121256 RepID=A0A1M4Z644_9THEO|nr:transcription-repair coupling factor [Caldanaerobius fijiensis]SHF13076.1 transcription-repair coupling factor [Caldanaerobius fijiensis DSM 17918]
MLIEPLKELKEFNALLNDLTSGNTPVLATGLTDTQRVHVAYAISRITGKRILYIAQDELHARKIAGDFAFFTDNVGYFPSKEIMFYKTDAKSNELTEKRLSVIEKLLYGDDMIIVASIKSLLNRLTPPDRFKQALKTLKIGDTLDLSKFAADLVSMGYERVDMIEGKGQFSIRGGIVDFFPITEEKPYRVELFDDEIDSIRIFDVVSQRTEDVVDSVRLFPSRELMVTQDDIKRATDVISKELSKQVEKLKVHVPDAAQRLSDKISEYIERLENGADFADIDLFINYFFADTATLLDYIGDAIIFVDEPDKIKQTAEAHMFEFQEDFKTFLQKGEVLPGQASLMAPYDEVASRIQSGPVVIYNPFMRSLSGFSPKSFVSFTARSMHPFHYKMDMLVDELNVWQNMNYRVVLLSGDQNRGVSLCDNLIREGIRCQYREKAEGNIQKGQVIVVPGTLSNGFEYPDIRFVVVSDEEIFGTARKKRSFIVKKEGRIKSFAELKPGDYVVHVNHGIGRYVGINKIQVDGVTRDYLYIQYAGADKLYVPVDQLDMIQKYIGSEDAPPKLSKLGGSEWARTKSKVKQSIKNIASELIKLYAERSAMKGYAYPQDTPWQRQFEDQFPYEETPDQLRAIEEVKADMESDKVMDRLLCGDVGYGKTEVAIRAAFKAAISGKQVAVLCPTTILAEQHYNTFSNRFKDFPIKVDMLSRFRSKERQKETIKGIKDGTVDVVIGTHRLLQKDVVFHDLGLLIIDEEQRFGVRHKERIKQLKKNVDVLTLTATPIPRTLYMSLLNIRDMSVLENPPGERFPVQTYVVEYNDALIRDAILKELNRGGQVYFVYNRVASINNMATYLAQLVPEASIAVAHGQMSEKQLENVMMQFYEGKYDILLCTTIIETGLDIPNVNTIIVYDADNFGLSQLYQLRGRVGRSNRLAYAYFTYRKDKVLSQEAEKRLEAIKEFTEFGSGFKLALRDLEIRGAGNILGAEQHGHMMSVGYDMYMRLMEEAIKELKGEPVEKDVEVSVDLSVNAYIDENYIPGEEQRLEMYKKIAAISSKDDVMDVEDELLDRFGDVPQVTRNLITIAYIKCLARSTGIVSITQRGDMVVLYLKDPIYLPDYILKEYKSRLYYNAEEKPYISLKVSQKPSMMLKELQDFLVKLKQLQDQPVAVAQ